MLESCHQRQHFLSDTYQTLCARFVNCSVMLWIDVCIDFDNNLQACFASTVVIKWLSIFFRVASLALGQSNDCPYSSGLLHWPWGNQVIVHILQGCFTGTGAIKWLTILFSVASLALGQSSDCPYSLRLLHWHCGNQVIVHILQYCLTGTGAIKWLHIFFKVASLALGNQSILFRVASLALGQSSYCPYYLRLLHWPWGNQVIVHILQGCFTGTGAIKWLPQHHWSNPEEYWQIDNIFLL